MTLEMSKIDSAPVAFIAFNRPNVTEITFNIIRRNKIPKLFIILDGPRKDNPEDALLCDQVKAIVEKIDWPCEVLRNYSEVNLGCKNRPSSGISWVFQHVDRCIILEDDCVPHDDFFPFCTQLLEQYKNSSQITTITGNNFQSLNPNQKNINDSSYYYSKYNHVWGWATWKRAWNLYDGDLKFWPTWKHSSEWRLHTPDNIERRFWGRIFNAVYSGRINTAWDYPWTASVWNAGGLTITPMVNLVSNIGFGSTATHTKIFDTKYAHLPVQSIMPIRHPNKIVRDVEADKFIFENNFEGYKRRFPYVLYYFPVKALQKLFRYLNG